MSICGSGCMAVGDGSTMVNRVEITKLGVTVAQVTEYFAEALL